MRFSVSTDILSAHKRAKLLPTDTILTSVPQNIQKMHLQRSPRPPTWISGREGGRKGERRGTRAKGEGRGTGKEGKERGKGLGGEGGLRVAPPNGRPGSAYARGMAPQHL